MNNPSLRFRLCRSAEYSTPAPEALERSLAPFLPACRCTGSRSRCSSPRACRASQTRLESCRRCCAALRILVTSLAVSWLRPFLNEDPCGLFAAASLLCLVLACSWVCSFLPAVGPLFSPAVGPLFSPAVCPLFYNPLWVRSSQCCGDHPSRRSGPQASLPQSRQSSLPQPKSSGFLSRGSPVAVMFTGACRCCSFCSCVFVTPCMTLSWHSMSCLANCSPVHVLAPWTPSRAARGLLV